MHDLDKVQAEIEPEEDFDFDPDSSEAEYESGGGPDISEETGVFDDAEALELAAELLDTSTDQELDEFIGNWFRKAARKLKRTLSTPAGRALGGLVKGAVKKILPTVAGAAGNLLLPGAGGALGSAASSLLGMELEGLSPQEQEMEAALGVIRLGSEAVRNAAAASPDEAAEEVAVRAFSTAAQRHAPGLLRPGTGGNGSNVRAMSGRWFRRGKFLIIEGV